MLEQIKGELEKRLELSSRDESLQKLYNDEVKILLEAIIAAQDIDDIAIQVKLNIAEEHFKVHRYQEVLVILDELLANQELLNEKERLTVLERKGVALTMTGKYEEAEQIFTEMLNAETVWARRKAHINLGVTYCYMTKNSGRKMLNEAMQHFAKAQELLEPADREDWFHIDYNLAVIHFEKGRFDECVNDLEMALTYADTDQQKAMVYNELARIYVVETKLDKAEQYLDKAEQILIKRPNFHELALAWNIHIRGLLNKKKGEYTNAINCLELALSTFVERELFSEAAEVSYELYALNKFLESGDADEYLADYQYYSRMIS